MSDTGQLEVNNEQGLSNQQPASSITPRSNNQPSPWIWVEVIFATISIVSLIVVGGYFFWTRYQNNQLKNTSNQSQTVNTDNNTVNEISGKKVELDEDTESQGASGQDTVTPQPAPNPVSQPLPVSPPALTGKVQTYTNQFFPNLKIVYDDTWKFQTSTKPSSVKGLLERTITLKKNTLTIEFVFVPTGSFGFEPIVLLDEGCKNVITQEQAIQKELLRVGMFPSGLKKHILNTKCLAQQGLTKDGWLIYGELVNPSLVLESNIKGSDIKYDKVSDSGYVQFNVAIKFSGLTEAKVSDVDAVFGASTFK